MQEETRVQHISGITGTVVGHDDQQVFVHGDDQPEDDFMLCDAKDLTPTR